MYAAQVIPQIDPSEIGFTFHGAGAEIVKPGTRPERWGVQAELGQNSHLWMETN